MNFLKELDLMQSDFDGSFTSLREMRELGAVRTPTSIAGSQPNSPARRPHDRLATPSDAPGGSPRFSERLSYSPNVGYNRGPRTHSDWAATALVTQKPRRLPPGPMYSPHVNGLGVKHTSRRQKFVESHIPSAPIPTSIHAHTHEVQMLKKWMDTMIAGIKRGSSPVEVLNDLHVLSLCFHEAVRQTCMHSMDLGRILARVWNSYIELFERAMTNYQTRAAEEENERSALEKRVSVLDSERAGVDNNSRELEKRLSSMQRSLLDKDERMRVYDENNRLLEGEVTRMRTLIDLVGKPDSNSQNVATLAPELQALSGNLEEMVDEIESEEIKSIELLSQLNTLMEYALKTQGSRMDEDRKKAEIEVERQRLEKPRTVQWTDEEDNECQDQIVKAKVKTHNKKIQTTISLDTNSEQVIGPVDAPPRTPRVNTFRKSNVQPGGGGGPSPAPMTSPGSFYGICTKCGTVGAAPPDFSEQGHDAGTDTARTGKSRKKKKKEEEDALTTHVPTVATEPTDEEKKNAARKTHRAKTLDDFLVKVNMEQVEPLSRKFTLKLITQIYNEKLQADQRDHKENVETQDLPAFVFDFMLNKFGLKTLAERNVAAFIQGIKKYRKEDYDRADIFGRLIGVLQPRLPQQFLDYFMYCYSILSSVGGKYKIELDDGDTMTPMHMIKGETITECCKPLSNNMEPHVQAAVLKGIERDEKHVKVHTCMGILIKFHENELGFAKKQLEITFRKADTDGDGVLTYPEFKDLLAQIRPNMRHRDVQALFVECLSESPFGDDDCMDPEAFVRVFISRGLYKRETANLVPVFRGHDESYIVSNRRLLEEAFEEIKGPVAQLREGQALTGRQDSQLEHLYEQLMKYYELKTPQDNERAWGYYRQLVLLMDRTSNR